MWDICHIEKRELDRQKKKKIERESEKRVVHKNPKTKSWKQNTENTSVLLINFCIKMCLAFVPFIIIFSCCCSVWGSCSSASFFSNSSSFCFWASFAADSAVCAVEVATVAGTDVGGFISTTVDAGVTIIEFGDDIVSVFTEVTTAPKVGATIGSVTTPGGGIIIGGRTGVTPKGEKNYN